MNLSHGTVVAVCLALAALATVVDFLSPSFDPQPLYVFLALILGQQGAKASSEKRQTDDDDESEPVVPPSAR